MNLRIFSQLDFLPAIKALFNALHVPMNYVADQPTSAKEILKDTYKDNETFHLINEVYFVGMVDDAAFEGNKSLDAHKIKSDYDGILIFGITLKDRPNGLLPTRSQLAEISRAFNREFYYTPVVVVFKYGPHIAFANTERLKYKQEWREGEKAGKVSLLRDIHIDKPHSGHERILSELQIPTTGTKRVDSFGKLYAYWQEVFSVSLLNKKFYQELSNWYFWATQHVTFPGEPTAEDAHIRKAKLEDLLQEHKATNVIRMLTRLLFVWFIKEKKLIPEELFELDALQKDILNDISPYHETGMFKERNKESIFYKAILQNLFFATLNCPIEADSLDKRKRGFRGDGYGTHRGIDYLMRYKSYFKNPDAFLKMLNSTVPFLNGGLFECLDEKYRNLYIDGFSDQMTQGEKLIVPDYLFFGVEEEADLSDIVGISDKKYKQAAVKGLINILKSYKFTITENTPIEEDVALDPELLGKVFENLLASYNPETKTTARKQTGSFYTPREIVNYMVDESLIAYLKNAISDWGGLDDETLDRELHVLTSFDAKVPFEKNPDLQKEIITALSTCTILDPACGSGAFPMGILQKMVHILQKLDPDNKVWKEVQLAKAEQESKAAFEIEDKQAREERLIEINEAFDQSINDPDYARKLFLIENCIYGVDIQPIATQISKLRFFISLVVEQKVNPDKANFGIRPLPNLETKFVAANTLIGIEKPSAQLSLYDTNEVKSLEKELKSVRHKLFSARTKETKLKYRQRDEELRNAIATELEKSGWKSDTAQKLAGWDPYDQNASSPFFDPEWMFDIQDGFDVVIGNPPYVSVKGISPEFKRIFSQIFETGKGRFNLFTLFIEKAIKILENNGVLTFIIPEGILSNIEYIHSRKYFLDTGNLNVISLFSERVFEAAVDTCVVSFIKNKSNQEIKIYQDAIDLTHSILKQEIFNSPNFVIPVQAKGGDKQIIESFMSGSFDDLSDLIELQQGIIYSGQAKEDVFSNEAINSNYKKSLDGRDISKWKINWNQKTENRYINYTPKLHRAREERLFISKPKIVFPRKANSIYCAIDMDSYYALNTAYVVLIKSTKCSYSYLAAWFNSKLVNFVYSKLYFGWQITIPALMTMKIKSPSTAISKLLDVLVFISPERFDQIIDSLVLNYYFPDHMKERGIDVLEFVERDINEVMQGRAFEKLSDTEKEQVIEALHAKWSHPDNEVVKRMGLFKERSPEILKPILES